MTPTKTERWNQVTRTFETNAAVDDFIADVIAVCRKHGFSIAHEDSHGGFIILPFSDENSTWLAAAAMELEEPNAPCGEQTK